MKSQKLKSAICVLSMVLSAGAERARADCKLIEIIPDDALFGLYVERPQRVLPPTLLTPLLNAMSADEETSALWLEAIKRVPGPILVAQLSPRDRESKELDAIVAMELRGSAVDFGELVKTTFLPALRRVGDVDEGDVRFEVGDAATRVFFRKREKPVFAYAVKDKVALGSTNAQLVLRWRRGDWPERRWVGLPGVKKMLGGLTQSASARFVINPPALLRLLDKPTPNSTDALVRKLLAPEEIQAAAVDLTWERSGLHLRGTVMMAEERTGVLSVLSRAAGPSRLLGVFPEDYVALGRIAFSSAAGIPRGVYAITDGFDETISAEYREESAEFRQEVGVDFENGLLARLVGEVAFGLRVDFTRPSPIGWAAVFSLSDGPAFAEELEKLIDHFGLVFEVAEVDGVSVRTSVDTYPFSMAICGEHFILGDVADTVVEIADRASKSEGGPPVGAELRACLASLGDSNQLCAMLDIKQLRMRAPMLPLLVGAKFAPLLVDGSVGASVTFGERTTRLDLHWSFLGVDEATRRQREHPESEEIEGADALVMLAVALGESVVEAREQSKRIVAMSNMRSLGQAIHIYAGQHNGAFPESLSGLFRALPDTVSLEQLVSPYDGKGPESISDVDDSCYVIYRAGLSSKSEPTEVLLAERVLHDNGANFLFVDGHVEFIQEPRASELIELIRGGANHGSD